MLCMWTESLQRLVVPCKKIPWDNNAQVLSQGGKGAKKQITILLIPGRDYQNYTCAGPICSLLLYNPIYLWCFWCPPPGRQKTCLWKAAKYAKKRRTVKIQPADDGHFSLGTLHSPRWPEELKETASFVQVIKCEQPVWYAPNEQMHDFTSFRTPTSCIRLSGSLIWEWPKGLCFWVSSRSAAPANSPDQLMVSYHLWNDSSGSQPS